MKVYVPMKLRADYVLQHEKFSDFEGLHYYNRDDAQEAMMQIRAPHAPMDAPKFGPRLSYQLENPAVSVLLTLEMPDEQFRQGWNNPMHHPQDTPPNAFYGKINPEQVQEIYVIVEGDMCKDIGTGFHLDKIAGFPLDKPHAAIQQCIESRTLFAEALKRTPNALLQLLPDIPKRVQDLNHASNGLYTMFSMRAIAHDPHPSSLSYAITGRFLHDMSGLCTTDAAMHIGALTEAMGDGKHLPTSAQDLTQLLEYAIKEYAEECCPKDYAIAMSLRGNAREYVQEALQSYKAIGSYQYEQAFWCRMPDHIADSLRITHAYALQSQDPKDPGRYAEAMATAITAAIKATGRHELNELLNEARNDAAQTRNDAIHNHEPDIRNETPDDI